MSKEEKPSPPELKHVLIVTDDPEGKQIGNVQAEVGELSRTYAVPIAIDVCSPKHAADMVKARLMGLPGIKPKRPYAVIVAESPDAIDAIAEVLGADNRGKEARLLAMAPRGAPPSGTPNPRVDKTIDSLTAAEIVPYLVPTQEPTVAVTTTPSKRPSAQR